MDSKMNERSKAEFAVEQAKWVTVKEGKSNKYDKYVRLNIEKAIKIKSNKPKIIMCSTVKGKGIPRMENKLFSHYKPAEISDLDTFL
jgi:transketolase